VAAGTPPTGRAGPDLGGCHLVSAGHAAALAALLDRADAPAGSADRSPVRRVLAHERRYWARLAAAHGLAAEPDDRLAETVTVATLCGAAGPDGARALLSALPAFTGGAGEVERHRRWHAESYPGQEPLPPLRPDRLGEELVAEVLADTPDLAAAVAPELDARQLARALMVLGRAAGRYPHLTAAMTDLMRADPVTAAPIAVAVATNTGDDLADGGALARALSELGAAHPALELLEHLPERSLVLTGLAVAATRAALRRSERRADADPAERAHLTHDLAVRLTDAGETEEALVRASDAVALLSTLDDPHALANGLDTLATALRGLGQYADALDRADEGLTVLPPGPSRTRVTLLSTRGNLLGDTGRHTEAVAVLDEAVRVSRVSAGPDPAPAAADQLATVLQNLAVALVDIDRLDGALAMATEAVALRAELDAQHPDRYRDDHILALSTLVAVHAERREHRAAARVADEAVTLARSLVHRHGARHAGQLADALNNSATVLRRIGDPERAVDRLAEAVAVYRELADARPAIELSALAAALHNLGNALDDLGRVSEALLRHDEAIDIYRKLVGPDGDPIGDVELAEALRARIGPRLDAGAATEAVADATESVALLRRHAGARDRIVLRKLAGALHELGRATADPEPAAEAVALFREIVTTDRDEDAEHDLSAALHGLAQHLDEAGRHAEAAIAFAELRGRLADDPDLRSTALHDEAVCRSELGEHAVALELISEAVELRRGLLDGSIGRRLELAESLNNLADTLHDVGRDADAVPRAVEAVDLCAQIGQEIDGDNARMHVICLLTMAGVVDGDERREALRSAAEIAGEDEDLRDLILDAETKADRTCT
jgi:tetratricopeptide (TPR) repeat protein